MNLISDKDMLGLIHRSFQTLFPSHFEFCPETYILPLDKPQVEGLKRDARKYDKTDRYLIKPAYGSQGKDIYFLDYTSIIADYNVVQKYICEPLLVQDLKFDLRLYVLVIGIDLMIVLIHDDGLVRFATKGFDRKSSDQLSHLTNYSIQKTQGAFSLPHCSADGSSGHKRSKRHFFDYLEKTKNIDTFALNRQIEDIIVKSLLMIKPKLRSKYEEAFPQAKHLNHCFEIIGFDVLRDQNHKPWLLEANLAP